MGNRITHVTAALLILALAGAMPVSAQIVYNQPVSGTIDFVYTSFETSRDDLESTISQLLVPVGGFVPVRDNFEVTFWGAGSNNTLSIGENDLELDGLTDIRLRANHSFQEDHFLVSLGLNLPTGATKLEQISEYPVLIALSEQYTSFPIRRLGEGLGISALVGAATQLSEQVQATGGLMFEYSGEYEPYENYDEYNPGDAFSINGALHYNAIATQWQLDMMFTLYSKDQVDGEDIFKQAPQFDVRLGVGLPGDTRSYSGFVRYLIRGESTEWIQDTTVSNQIEIIELDPIKLYGNEFVMGGAARFDFEKNWYLKPSADFRLIQGNDIGIDQTNVFGIGTAIGGTWAGSVVTELGFRYYTGSIDDGNADLTGYQLSLGMTVSP